MLGFAGELVGPVIIVALRRSDDPRGCRSIGCLPRVVKRTGQCPPVVGHEAFAYTQQVAGKAVAPAATRSAHNDEARAHVQGHQRMLQLPIEHRLDLGIGNGRPVKVLLKNVKGKQPN